MSVVGTGSEGRTTPQPTAVRLVRSTALYAIGDIIGKLMPLAAIPVFARLLGPEEFAQVQLVLPMIAIVAVLANLSLDTALVRFLPTLGSTDDRQNLVNSILALDLIVTVLFAAVVYFAASWFPEVLHSSPRAIEALLAGMLIIPTAAVRATVLNVLRADARSAAFVLVLTTDAILGAGFGIALVVLGQRTARSVLLGTAAGSLISSACGLLAVRSMLGRFHFPRALASKALQYSIPVLVASLGLWLMSFLDRYLLAPVVSSGALGSYTLATKVAGLMLLLGAAVERAWLPYVFSRVPDSQHRSIQLGQSIAVSGAVGLGLALIPLSTELVRLAGGPAFASAGAVLPYLLPGTACQGLISVLAIGLLMEQRTRAYAGIVLAGGAANCVLNLVLVRWAGPSGAAIASSVAWLLAAAACQRTGPAYARWSPGYGSVILIGALYAAAIMIARAPVGGALGIALRVTSAVVIASFGFVAAAGLDRIRELRAAVVNR